MRIDSAGMVVPDVQPAAEFDAAWTCPDGCGKPTWPGIDSDSRVVPRRCVPCQAVADLAAEEMQR